MTTGILRALVFTLDGNVLKTGVTFDFEGQSSYEIRVRSTDTGGLFIERTFTIQIDDVRTSIAWDGGGGDGVWSNAANWTGDLLPGDDHDVAIELAFASTTISSSSSVSVRSITSSAPLVIQGGSFHAETASTLSDLSISGGIVSGFFTVTDRFDWTGGEVAPGSTLDIATGVVGTISSSPALWGTLNNSGQLTIQTRPEDS